jgi:hypothetical protein
MRRVHGVRPVVSFRDGPASVEVLSMPFSMRFYVGIGTKVNPERRF